MKKIISDPEHLASLQDYYARHRVLPSYNRLMPLLGFASRSGIKKVLARMLHKQSALKRLTSCGIEIAAFENEKRSLPYPLSRRVAAGWTVIGRDGWPILD